MNTETHFITPNEDTEINLVIPVPDIGNGEESLIVGINENSINFEVLDDQDNVIYNTTLSYGDFCNYIEARDLYWAQDFPPNPIMNLELDEAIQRHPAGKKHLQVIDGGGNKGENK